jgi:UDP-glucose 4-epimerase
VNDIIAAHRGEAGFHPGGGSLLVAGAAGPRLRRRKDFLRIAGKKLAVVGGAGLIGSHLVDRLTAEDAGEIVVFDNFVRGRRENLQAALADPRVTLVDGDIRAVAALNRALKGTDGVFHLAALWLLECHEQPRAALDVNIQGTFNVLEACRDQGVERLVFSSSASVYGDAVAEPMDEDHPLNNTNFYGATKVAGEQMLRAFHHRYGLDYAGLRYMNVYGPRQDDKGAYVAVIVKMLDAIERGEAPVVYGDGSQAYDFVHVADCARANVLAMKADTRDRFYNVGTGIRTTIRELAELIVRLTNSNQAIRFEPGGQTFVKNRIGCPKRAAAEFGFSAEIGLEDGLRDVIRWRRERRAGAVATGTGRRRRSGKRA